MELNLIKQLLESAAAPTELELSEFVNSLAIKLLNVSADVKHELRRDVKHNVDLNVSKLKLWQAINNYLATDNKHGSVTLDHIYDILEDTLMSTCDTMIEYVTNHDTYPAWKDAPHIEPVIIDSDDLKSILVAFPELKRAYTKQDK